MNYSGKQILKAVSGNWVSGDENQTFSGLSIDSRTVKAGQLFVCIKGDQYDGHDFISNIVQKNVAGIILSDKEKIPSSDSLSFFIKVKDTLKALQDLAAFHRSQFDISILAITGTNGKSTTKEMTSAVAESQFKVLKTEGNKNNHIGLPLTLLNLNADHEVAVLEMGMSTKGEIRRLAEIAKPQIGIITNISEGHLESLPTIRDVQEAKGELFESLQEESSAIINADDPLVLELSRSLRSNIVTYGIKNSADIQASNVKQRGNEGFDFTLNFFNEKTPVFLPFLGSCNISNALAAIAAGHVLGLSSQSILTGLQNCKLMPQRMQTEKRGGITIINDAYNANPKSMEEALNTLSKYQTNGKKFFVMGDMLELGNLSEQAHKQFGKLFSSSSIDLLITVGSLSQLAAQTARDSGLDENRVVSFENKEEISQFLSKTLQANDCMLVKGSRSMGMEQIIDSLSKLMEWPI
jgi:UDP-N-acetylmuramoyl-tripeptide--D-alanyl-D-alanine ligase